MNDKTEVWLCTSISHSLDETYKILGIFSSAENGAAALGRALDSFTLTDDGLEYFSDPKEYVMYEMVKIELDTLIKKKS